MQPNLDPPTGTPVRHSSCSSQLDPELKNSDVSSNEWGFLSYDPRGVRASVCVCVCACASDSGRVCALGVNQHHIISHRSVQAGNVSSWLGHDNEAPTLLSLHLSK